MKSTLTPDMPAHVYRAAEGISASDIKWILPPRTPAHYAAYRAGEVKREETRAMTIGTLVHLAVLEPDKLDGAFIVKPAGLDMRTVKGKEWKEKAGDLPILDQSDADMLKGMRDSVWAHPDAKAFLENSQKEVSMFLDHASGLTLKGRADMVGESFIGDVKTCESADPASFGRSMSTFNYHVQAAMYLLLSGKDAFDFVCVEKIPPYAVAVYEIAPQALEVGRRLLDTAIATIALCEETSSWPGYGDGITFIDLPQWAYKSQEVAA